MDMVERNVRRLIVGIAAVAGFFTLVFLFASCLPAHAQDIERMVGSNFLLSVGGEARCSATLLSTTSRIVLTNYHCVDDAIKNVEREETQPDGTVRKVTRTFTEPVALFQHAYSSVGIVGRTELRAEIKAFDQSVDLAALRILSETTTLVHAAALPPEAYVLRQGQEVWAVGNPALLENTVSRGLLNHLYREYRWGPDKVSKYLQIDAAITGGSSGGALYSKETYLIGVPSAGYRGAALSFAIPITVIRAFLEKHGLLSQ